MTYKCTFYFLRFRLFLSYHGYVLMSAVPMEAEKEGVDSLELELQAIVSLLMQVLETALASSVRALPSPNHLDISPVSK